MEKQLLKIKHSVKTFVSVAPLSGIHPEHCTFEYGVVQRRLTLQQSLEWGSSVIHGAWRASWVAVQFLVINTHKKLLHGSGRPVRTWRSEWKGKSVLLPSQRRASVTSVASEANTPLCPPWACTRSQTSACTS